MHLVPQAEMKILLGRNYPRETREYFENWGFSWDIIGKMPERIN